MHVTVGPAASGDLDAACRMLASSRPGPLQAVAAARYRDLFASGEFDRAGLFVARDDPGALCGAMMVQSLPGAMGLAWPPRARQSRGRASIEDALATAACHWLRGRGVAVCQAFGREDERRDFAALERHGFRWITQVTDRRLAIDLPRDAGSVLSSPSPLRFEAFDSATSEPAASVLLATYEGSRDCPELNGGRTPEQLLAGLTEQIAILPQWQFLAWCGSVPVGVVLLCSGTEPGVLELNYLGLIPSFRGRGWGESLVRRALLTAVDEGCHTVALSVDVRNEPALRLYDRLGFRECARRNVYLAVWPKCS